MSFGGQTVSLVTVSLADTPGKLGLREQVRTTVDIGGCRFRQLSSTESPESQTDVAGATWKLTLPPTPEALAATSTGEIRYEGETFQIVGPVAPKFDIDGTVHHVTIVCKRHQG